MASTNSSIGILGILAILVVIAAAIYFVVNEADDDELEIDIGMSHDAPALVITPAHG